MFNDIILRWRGVESYEVSFNAMRVFTAKRTLFTTDEIWLVEHLPVYTLGQAGDSAHLLTENNDIALIRVDRGGQITYHGPGQVIAYLLTDLRRRRIWVRDLVTCIEQAVIDTLATYNLVGKRQAGAPGIYVEVRSSNQNIIAKIAALGLKIRNGCSYHGVSLNLQMDLKPFYNINPCGYVGLQTVDMASLGVLANWHEVAQILAERLMFNLPPIAVFPSSDVASENVNFVDG
ncbi:lipoyl(octanoyl) transferase LipB [Candidatus Vallotia lariciata]|uniref:lipoyl(octanoyl) transferase LipB n=1 Tax=Candidatus Vallotia laricis TaxID=2018052 RepID=UPI001D034D94|nr:lipoyl(octanoyl) transferase LipB [Candidatus Vallotia lariciata]UDG83333.1 Octanoyltransferase [Candidatus Vallotia lariciata]